MRFFDPTLVVLTLTVITSLVILAAMLRRRKLRGGLPGPLSGVVMWRLFAFAAFALAWAVIQGLGRLQSLRLIAGVDALALWRISHYLLLGLAVIFFQLTRLFTRRTVDPGSPRTDLPWWAAGAGWLLLAVLLYELPALPDTLVRVPGFVIPRWLAAQVVLVAGWAFFMGYAVLLTLRDYRRSGTPLHHNRNQYWRLALFLAAAAAGLGFAQQSLAASVLLLVAVFTVLYVLLTFNLPDLRLAARGAATYAIMTLVAVALYTAAYLAAQAILARQNPLQLPGQILLAGGILALALVVLLNPLIRLVQRLVQRLISGTGYDPRKTLAQYSQSISNVLDMDVLATIVTGLISEALEIDRGALVTVTHVPGEETVPLSALAEGTVGYFRLHFTSGMGERLPDGRLSGKNPAVNYLRRQHYPLAQYDIDLLPRFLSMEAAEREWFDALKMDIYVPIYTKDTWTGLLVLGPKISGDRYFDEDLAFLQTLADQTAVALENARLYDNLKQRNTENEQLNAELTAANQELARLDRAKSDFINIASHELRTPLTQIMGYNEILTEMVQMETIDPGEASQMTDAVRRAARRLEEIVETMFDVSKLDTRTLDLERSQVSLASVIGATLDGWRKALAERQLSVTVRDLSGLPAINADGKRLAQVFSNLIQNAIKSTPDGGEITISGALVDVPETGAPAVEIVVADTGIGIAPEEIERIFEKFYRVGSVLLHSSGNTKFKGAGPGLGLTIARGIIEAHGGHIWAESPGHDESNCPGTEFHVMLPVGVHVSA